MLFKTAVLYISKDVHFFAFQIAEKKQKVSSGILLHLFISQEAMFYVFSKASALVQLS